MKLAVPTGHLKEVSLRALDDAGYSFLEKDRSLRLTGVENIDARFFKPRSIPELIEIGAIDIGFVGLDLVLESGVVHAVPLINLKRDSWKIVVAAKENVLSHPPSRPLIVASEYPALAEKYMMQLGLSHVVLKSFGTTEAYLPDIADVIVECVATGATLRANGLVIVEELMVSSTWIVVHPRALERSDVQQFLEKFR